MSLEDFKFSTATPEERAEHLRQLKERVLQRKNEAEEELSQIEDDDEDEDEEDKQARIERMAAAETRVVEQMAKERAGKPKQNNKRDGDESYFNPELEKLIKMALEDGNITEKEREVLHKKAQALGVDPDELDMVLSSRLEKMQDRKQNGGKYFIENLKKEINDVCILEMGTYGKKVEDTRETKKRREEILLAANPTTPSEIKEYLYFLSGYLDAEDYEYSWQRPYWEKFESVYTKAQQEFTTDTGLLSSIKALRTKVYAPIVKNLRKKIIKWATLGFIFFPIAIVKIISLSKKIREIQK